MTADAQQRVPTRDRTLAGKEIAWLIPGDLCVERVCARYLCAPLEQNNSRQDQQHREEQGRV